jgi:hypothetical protein
MKTVFVVSLQFIFAFFVSLLSSLKQGRSQGGEGCRAAAPLQTPENRNLKNTDFVDIMISKYLRDLPFS